MELECCGEKGWMRLIDVDVANGEKCSNEWHKIRAPVAAYRAPSDDAGCYPAHLSTHHAPYYTRNTLNVLQACSIPHLFVHGSNGYHSIVLNTYALIIVVFDNLKVIATVGDIA